MGKGGTGMNTAKLDNSGTCALCLIADVLRHSHIISEFLYSAIYDEKHRFHVVDPNVSTSIITP